MRQIKQGLLLGFSLLLITACGDRAKPLNSEIISPVEINISIVDNNISRAVQTYKNVGGINSIELSSLENGYAIEGYNYNDTTVNLSFCRNIITYGRLVEKFSIVDDVMKSPSVVIETAEGVLNINSNYDLGVYNDITITSMSEIEC